MALSVADPIHNDVLDHRPLKRPRKAAPTKQPDPEPQFEVQPPVDHIFISEGNVIKKPGGKKVRVPFEWRSGALLILIEIGSVVLL